MQQQGLNMEAIKRHIIANKLFYCMFLLLAIIAYIDAHQIITFHTLNMDKAWELYNTYNLPSMVALYMLIILVPAWLYYLFTKDKSETIGLFVSWVILLSFGIEDVLFFLFSTQPMTACMAWFNQMPTLVGWFSTNILKEACVSPFGLITCALVGTFLAKAVFNKSLKIKG